jgi:protease I
MKPALLIIAQDRYQDKELDGTRQGLEDAGFEIVLASSKKGTCTGKFGGTEEATVAMKDIDVSEYDRIAFIGGPGAANLWQDKDAKRIAQDANDAGMPLGAICIAPKILAAAEVLGGRKATVWNLDGDQAGFLGLHDVHYIDQPVVIDGNIITGNGPEAAEEFGKKLGEM